MGMYAAPQQAVYADPGQQMIYVDEHGRQVAAPGLQYVQPGPSVFNVSHGQFSQIAQGGALTQDQIQTMVGQAPAVASAEQAAGVTPTPAPMATAPTSEGSKKKEKKSKALSSKKKKQKGCC